MAHKHKQKKKASRTDYESPEEDGSRRELRPGDIGSPALARQPQQGEITALLTLMQQQMQQQAQQFTQMMQEEREHRRKREEKEQQEKTEYRAYQQKLQAQQELHALQAQKDATVKEELKQKQIQELEEKAQQQRLHEQQEREDRLAEQKRQEEQRKAEERERERQHDIRLKELEAKIAHITAQAETERVKELRKAREQAEEDKAARATQDSLDRSAKAVPKPPPMVEGEDLQDYLDMFEQTQKKRLIAEKHWSSHLLPLLEPKRRAVATHLSPEDREDYRTLKAAVLKTASHTPQLNAKI